MAHAADPPKSALTVAVYDFSAEPDAASYATKVTTLVTVNLTTETNLVMLERAELTKALKEQAFGISGMVSSDAAAKIGQITGAKVLVAGQVMKLGDNHLVLVADIIGTETGRLFAAKVEGAPDNLMVLTDELSRKIARTISDQRTNLLSRAQESEEERLERIIGGLGTNRPSVSVDVHWYSDGVSQWVPSPPGNTEFGRLLLKAGFTTFVGTNSARKADMQIIVVEHTGPGVKEADFFSFHTVDEVKVMDRRTGAIIALEHQEATGMDASSDAAKQASRANVIDAVAEKILPLLAK
jgi:TolB-like protein